MTEKHLKLTKNDIINCFNLHLRADEFFRHNHQHLMSSPGNKQSRAESTFYFNTHETLIFLADMECEDDATVLHSILKEYVSAWRDADKNPQKMLSGEISTDQASDLMKIMYTAFDKLQTQVFIERFEI